MGEDKKVLLIGFGNPGRLDDGLGPALAKLLEEENIPGLSIDSNYQLAVEDAAEISQHAVVIFVDASLNGPAPFDFLPLEPRSELSYTGHIMSPEALLALTGEVFGKFPRAYMLSVRGYEFDEFGERLSPGAQTNLEAARGFLINKLRDFM